MLSMGAWGAGGIYYMNRFFPPKIFLLSIIAVVGLLVGLCNCDKLGDAFLNQNECAVAVPFYVTMTSVAAVVDPDHHRLADAWTNLGVCYDRLGNEQAAQQAQQTALQYRRVNDSGKVATADGAP